MANNKQDGHRWNSLASLRRKMSQRKSHPKAGRHRPLRFEGLEHRHLLATVTWTGSGDGQTWEDASNWTRNGSAVAPQTGDDVVIPNTGDPDVKGDMIVRSSGTVALNSLQSAEAVLIVGGGIHLANESQIEGGLRLSGGEIGGAGDILLSGDSTWTSGTMRTGGKTVVASGATFTISSESAKYLGRRLENAGTVNYVGTGLLFGPTQNEAGAIHNLSGGVFHVVGDGDFGPYYQNSAHQFANSGAVIRSGAGTSTLDGVAFHHNGSADVREGKLVLAAGGSTTGHASIVAGLVELTAGNYKLNADSAISGGGKFQVAGGTLEVAGSSRVHNFGLTSGDSGIYGNGDLTITGTADWTGGTMRAGGKSVVANGATFTISSETAKYLGRRLENAGTVNYVGSGLLFGPTQSEPGSIYNLSAGRIHLVGEGDIGPYYENGQHSVTNQGLINRSGEGTTTLNNVALHNNGSLDVQQGKLQLAAGGSTSGNAAIVAGVVEVTGGTYTLNANAAISGSGMLSINGGNLQAVAAAAVNNFRLTAGQVGGEGDLTIRGTADWSGGTMRAGGKTIVSTTAALSISGVGAKYLGRTLEISGTVHYTGSGLLFGPTQTEVGVINNLNGATFNITGPGSAFTPYYPHASHAFHNRGALVRHVGGSTVFTSVAFHHDGSIQTGTGSVILQAGGSTTGQATLVGGTVELAAGNYKLTEGASIAGAGKFRVSGGALEVAGASTIQNFALAAGENGVYGSGDLTIAGTAEWLGGSMRSGGKTIVSNTALLSITGAAAKYLGRTLEVAGTADMDAVLLFGPTQTEVGTIHNLAGATFTVRGESDFDLYYGNSNHTFHNRGTFVHTGSGTTTFAAVTFNSSDATIRMESGNLELARGGAVHGQLLLDSGEVKLTGGTHVLQSGVQVQGSGRLTIAGATLDVANISSVSALNLASGSLVGASDLTIPAGGEFNWSGGIMSGSGKTVVSSNGTLNIVSETEKYLGRRITNSGALQYTGSSLLFGPVSGSIGVIDNLEEGTLSIEGDGNFTRYYDNSSHAVNNQGAVVRTGDGITEFVGVAFNNSGAIDIRRGTFQLGALGRSTGGNFAVNTNASIDLSGHKVEGSFTGTGSGTVLIANDVQIVGDGAAFDFPSGMLRWTQGTLAGSPLTNRGHLAIVGGIKYLSTTLNNTGTLEYAAGDLLFGPTQNSLGIINNLAGATFVLVGHVDLNHYYPNAGHALNNQGTLVHRGSGTSEFTGVGLGNQGGNIRVEEGSLHFAAENSLAFADNSRLESLPGTAIRVPGSITGSTTNAGQFAPEGTTTLIGGSAASPRLLEVMGQDRGAVSGGYQQNSAYGTLQLESAHVRLTDSSDNTPGGGAEAIYVNHLAVPLGSTLDLNQLRLYARTSEIAGSILGGTVTVLPAGITVTPTTGLLTHEARRSATFRVVLNSPPTYNVVIPLASSQPSEGTVSPQSLTFAPTNWNTAQTVIVTGSDDQVDDGDVTYSVITAPAASDDTNYNGLNASDVSVTNVDNDPVALAVNVVATSISESAGASATTVVISRNSDPGVGLVVQLASSDPSEARIAANVTIPLGESSISVHLDAVDDSIADGAQIVSISASAPGFVGGSDTVTVSDNETLRLMVNVIATSVSEHAGAAATTVVVSRNSDTAGPLTVNLSSNDTSEATVPATATIPAGQASVTVNLSAVDDLLVDGTRVVSVTATAPGFVAGSDTLSVTDNDVPALTVSIEPSSVTENSGANTATIVVSRNTDVSRSLTVSLSSSDTSEAIVPATVTFPAGQASLTVNLTAVDDLVVDDTLVVTVTAVAPGFVSGSDTVNVTDNDTGGNGTLTLVVHGFGFDRNISEWAIRIAEEVTEELEKYSTENATYYVSWDGGATSNEEPTTQIAERIADFLEENTQVAIWDLLLIGHSRGGVFINKVLDKLNEVITASSRNRLGYVQQILLDPTGAAPPPFLDYFPTGIPTLVDRTIDYHDNHTLFNDLLGLIPWFGDIRKVINLLGRTFPNGVIGDFQQWFSRFASITLDSDESLLESSFTLGEDVDVHERMLNWPGRPEFAASEFADDVASLYDLVQGSAGFVAWGAGLQKAWDVVRLMKEIDGAIPEWIKSKIGSGFSTYIHVLHSVHYHINIQDWWRENQLRTDMDTFIRAKHGWGDLSSHVINVNPQVDLQDVPENRWNAYAGSVVPGSPADVSFPPLENLKREIVRILRDGFAVLYAAGVDLKSMVRTGFDTSLLASGNNVSTSLRNVADALFQGAKIGLSQTVKSIFELAKEVNGNDVAKALKSTADAIQGGIGDSAKTLAQALRVLGAISWPEAAINVKDGRLTISGRAMLPLVGEVRIKGSIQSSGAFSLSASLDKSAFGIKLSKVVLSNDGIEFAASAPLVGDVMLKGTFSSPTKFRLSATLNKSPFGIKLSELTVTNNGFSIAASAPLVGDMTLTGKFTSATKFNVSATLDRSRVGIKLSKLTLTNNGFSIAASAPLVGDMTLTGSLTSPTKFSVSATLDKSKFGIKLSKLTLNNNGFSIAASAPLVGDMTLSGTLTSATNFTVTASLSESSFGIVLNKLTLTNNGFSIAASAPLVGDMTLTGWLTSPTKFSVSATLDKSKLGIKLSKLTLTSTGFSIAASAPLVGDLTLSGTLTSVTRFSVTATLDRSKFGVKLSKLTLTNNGFEIDASAVLIGDVKLKGTFISPTDFSVSASLNKSLAGASLKSVTVSNSGASVYAWLPFIGNVSLEFGIYQSSEHGRFGRISIEPNLNLGVFKVKTVRLYSYGSFSVEASAFAVGTVWVNGPDLSDLSKKLTDLLPKLNIDGPKVGGVVGSVGKTVSDAGKSIAKAFNGITSGDTIFFDSDKNGRLNGVERPFEAGQQVEAWTVANFQGEFLAEAPIEFDKNSNGILDDEDGQWVVLGGVFSASGLPARIVRSAPGSWAMITPVTSLVTTLINERGFTTQQAAEQVLQGLGLPNVDLGNFDPLREMLAGNSNGGDVLRAHARITNTATQLIEMFSDPFVTTPEDLSSEDLSRIIMSTIAQRFVTSSSRVRFDDPSEVRALIRDISARLERNLPDESTNAAATVIADANQQLDRLDQGLVGLEFIRAVEQIKTIAQGSIAESLNMLVRGEIEITAFLDSYTGDALATKIRSAEIRPRLLVPTDYAVEATSTRGAEITISHQAHDLAGQPLAVTTSHASGSVLPLGSTVISASATDSLGTTGSSSFTIRVIDTTPPALNAPAEVIVEATGPDGANVNYSATATDVADPNPTVRFDVPSGVFALGDRLVTATATDASGNASEAIFRVMVADTTPPSIRIPQDFTIEATRALGATINLPLASATDLVDANPLISYDAESGFFPLESTIVTATATDSSGNVGQATFRVTVVDTTPPVLTAPQDIVIEADVTGGASFVLPDVLVSDVADPNPVVTHNVTSPFLPLGTTTVTLTATDASGNSSSGTFKIQVVDTTPPVIDGPLLLALEATEHGGTTITLPVTTTDVADANPILTLDVTSRFFPLGATPVVATAKDAAGNVSTLSMTVAVVDTTPPTFTLPADIIVRATDSNGANVNLPQVTTTDQADSNPHLTLDAVSGIFPVGSTIVTVTATDASGNEQTGRFSVIVVDGNAPLMPVIAQLGQDNLEGASIEFQGRAIDGLSLGSATNVAYTWTVFKTGSSIAYANASGTDMTGFSFVPDDQGEYRVVLSVSAEGAASLSTEILVSIENTAPQANVTYTLVRSDTDLTVHLSATVQDLSSADSQAPFTFDWSVTRNGQPFVSASHQTGQFSFNPQGDGQFAAIVKVSDKDGGRSLVTLRLSLSRPAANGMSLTIDEDSATSSLLSASDADGDALSYQVVAGPSHGTFALEQDGAFTYQPESNYHGIDRVTYRSIDGHEASPAATLTISITPIADPPEAHVANLETPEDQLVQGQLAGTDGDGDSLLYELVEGPSIGTAVVNADGSFTFTPAANFEGEVGFTFRVRETRNTASMSEPVLASISVVPINDAPITSNSVWETDEDTPFDGILSAEDVEDDRLEFSLVDAPRNGSLEFAAEGTFVYRPNLEFSGTDTFTYRVQDGQASSHLATVTISVSAVDDPPVAGGRIVTTAEDTAVSGSVSATDVDTNALTFAIVDPPAHGTVEMGTDGRFVYTPNSDYYGIDRFEFEARDGNSSHLGTVAISVTPINDAPVVFRQTISPDEDTVVDGRLTAQDGDSAALVYRLVDTTNAHGVVTLKDAATGVFAYTPDANYFGQASFTYQVTDGELDSSIGAVSFLIKSVNDVPAAIRISIEQQVRENISGEFLGTLSVRDADFHQTHELVVLDGRFEIEQGKLKLKSDQYLSRDDGDVVSIGIRAIDSGFPAQSLTETLVIQVAEFPRPWRNTVLHLDSNADGTIAPIDALLLINLLNVPGTLLGPGGLLPRSRPGVSTLAYFDSSGDGYCTAIDVLLIINHINDAAGEGERYNTLHVERLSNADDIADDIRDERTSGPAQSQLNKAATQRVSYTRSSIESISPNRHDLVFGDDDFLKNLYSE